MVDYYPFLLRAVQATDFADEAARRAVYVRAWQIVTDELRARRPPVSVEELRGHRSAIQSAIERIEHEYSAAPPDPGRGREMPAPTAGFPRDRRFQLEELPFPEPAPSRRGIWVAAIVAVLVLAIGVGGYAAWTAWRTMVPKPEISASRIEAAIQEPPLRRRHTVVASASDLAPGVDGGSTDADVSYIFRRQRVFYRTELPVGTIVVDKPQHLMYLVLPNSAALRYGIGVGASCAEIIGQRLVARKSEWPVWTPPQGSGRAEPMPGGPGNPLGSRLIDLDDNISRIHGTNAPRTIGEDVATGCVRLVNDDATDLYDRVPIGTRVVMR